jgi:adenylate kinase family enzyme
MMERVLVIGSGGAGKTTVARTLADRLQLPLIHLDAHYWKAGWVETPADQWEQHVQSMASQPQWVMDGNYGGTLDLRLAACDSVVFLDMPRRVSLWRAIKRWVKYWGRTRPDVAPGCPERFTWSFLVWIWTYRTSRREKILRKLGALQHARIFVLSSQRQVDEFLKSIG